MRIPKKNSRKITINDKQYLWRVSGYHRYRKQTPPVLNLIIQEIADKPGNAIKLSLKSKFWTEECNDEDNVGCFHKNSLMPKDVGAIISHCLSNGWNPSQNENKCIQISMNNYDIGNWVVE
jgi:hypothetical protein